MMVRWFLGLFRRRQLSLFARMMAFHIGETTLSGRGK